MKVTARQFFLVWVALMALGAASFGLSFLQLGALEAPLALLIATVKAVLVVAFFMHVIEQGGTRWLYLLLAALFVVTMVSLMALDVAERDVPSSRAR